MQCIFVSIGKLGMDRLVGLKAQVCSVQNNVVLEANATYMGEELN